MTITTRAIVADGDGKPVGVEEIEVPDPGPHDLLIRPLACGICHSDLFVLRSSLPGPTVLGHEVAAVIEAVGSAVEGLAAGDYGIIAWRAPCGQCRSCRRGHIEECERPPSSSAKPRRHDGTELRGVLGIGGFAERLLVAERQFIPVGRHVPPTHAGLIGCGVMTGFGAAVYAGGVQPGDIVAVFGCGGVGDAAIAGASIAGAAMVIAVDVNPRKFEAARHFGATHVVDASKEDPVRAILALSEQRGADVVVEAVGRPDAFLQAFYSHSRTGTLVPLGIADESMTVTIPVRDIFGRGPIKPSHYGDCLPTRDFPVLVDLYDKGRLDLAAFVSETIGIEEVPQAFERMEHGDILRSVIVFPED